MVPGGRELTLIFQNTYKITGISQNLGWKSLLYISRTFHVYLEPTGTPQSFVIVMHIGINPSFFNETGDIIIHLLGETNVITKST